MTSPLNYSLLHELYNILRRSTLRNNYIYTKKIKPRYMYNGVFTSQNLRLQGVYLNSETSLLLQYKIIFEY
ncbi:hypothetical protein SKL01_20120 [Staphylococcus kloosii]|uniref:Uncharacterized protein n=1 Tax=Staphylococcus kloosii TaxID=29384 RepID=A0ABQ0XRK8_9STAP|nr:hypothetical protein SKL01_20120 [Staphylococcus kloosii]